MASQVFSFQVTIPPGTPLATPFRQNITLPDRKVDILEITVPPGPGGAMGFAITTRGINVIPTVAGTYIVTDDRHISWPLTDQPTSGDWEVSGYNTGVWPHTVYLDWLVDLVDIPASQPLLTQVTLQQLSS